MIVKELLVKLWSIFKSKHFKLIKHHLLSILFSQENHPQFPLFKEAMVNNSVAESAVPSRFNKFQS